MSEAQKIDLSDDVVALTLGDLHFRVKNAEHWGVTDAEKLVAKTAQDWAKSVLDLKDQG